MRAYIINDGEVLGEYPIADNDPISADHRARKYAADVHGATVEQRPLRAALKAEKRGALAPV